MRFEEIEAHLRGIPLMPPGDGRIVYDFVREAGVRHVLELGFAHGTSSCYIAAAVQENGGGRVVSIDRASARARTPSIHDLVARTGLGGIVEPVFADTSYNWELMKRIEARTTGGRCEPEFDFVFLDGAHAWEPDGLAFFLADKLLRPGGWMLFDDLRWTYASSPALAGEAWVAAMPEEERTTPQVQKILDLLVAQHPDYEAVEARANWGWARKRGGAAGPSPVAAAYAKRPATAKLRAAAGEAKRKLGL